MLASNACPCIAKDLCEGSEPGAKWLPLEEASLMEVTCPDPHGAMTIVNDVTWYDVGLDSAI